MYLSKEEWSFYNPAHLPLFNQSSSTYGRTPLSTRHMLLVLLRLWLSMFVRFPTFLRVTMCSDGAGTVKSQHKWGQWRLTHIQKNYTQIDDDDMVVVVMVSLLSTGLVELLRHHHRRLIWRLDFDNAPIITNDYHHCQYHGLVKTKFTKSNILFSSPRAESARAVTGRRCPYSGNGEDFLTGQPDFLRKQL